MYYMCTYIYSVPCLDNPAYDLRFVDPIISITRLVTSKGCEVVGVAFHELSRGNLRHLWA